ncbi:AAA family ATPase [Labrys neptuniae]
MSSLEDLLTRLKTCIENASTRLVDRRSLVELVFLGLIAREHLLFIGPPGTAKSAAVRLAADEVGGRYFEYLIGRFTEPAEIFGSLDLDALRQGRIRPDVTDMLPEAELAFLDEIFLGSTAILNTLLGLLNERRFRRGHYEAAVPLRSCVAASNQLPEDPMLQAFADRFLVTLFVEPVGDHALEDLLASGWEFGRREFAPRPSTPSFSMADLDRLHDELGQVDMAASRAAYAHIIRKLRSRRVALSDRRIVKGQKLIAAAALLAGRRAAEPADLWPIVYLVQDRGLQQEVRDLLANELSDAANTMLPQAVRDASFGPTARAAELEAYGQTLLAEMPAREPEAAFESWLVKAEALLTQIDAGFAPDKLPENLVKLHTDIASRCAELPPTQLEAAQ